MCSSDLVNGRQDKPLPVARSRYELEHGRRIIAQAVRTEDALAQDRQTSNGVVEVADFYAVPTLVLPFSPVDPEYAVGVTGPTPVSTNRG